MLRKILSGVSHVTIMLCLGFAIYYYFLSPVTRSENPSLQTQEIFAASLPDANGVMQTLNQYKGKIIVLNFWATWCPPCREEMPELSQLHTEYQNKNVVVLGIAIDEPNLVKEFIQSTHVSYPLFAAENEGMILASHLGNNKGVLPYTIIIDSNGKVTRTYFGRINKTLLEADLRPLLPH